MPGAGEVKRRRKTFTIGKTVAAEPLICQEHEEAEILLARLVALTILTRGRDE